MKSNTLDRNRLIACREKLGITKQEAAKRMQLSQPAYLRYESGERTPSIHVIQMMANVLATSTAYLTGKSDNPTPDIYLIKSDTDPNLFSLIQKYYIEIHSTQRIQTFNQKTTVISQLMKIKLHMTIISTT